MYHLYRLCQGYWRYRSLIDWLIDVSPLWFGIGRPPMLLLCWQSTLQRCTCQWPYSRKLPLEGAGTWQIALRGPFTHLGRSPFTSAALVILWLAHTEPLFRRSLAGWLPPACPAWPPGAGGCQWTGAAEGDVLLCIVRDTGPTTTYSGTDLYKEVWVVIMQVVEYHRYDCSFRGSITAWGCRHCGPPHCIFLWWDISHAHCHSLVGSHRCSSLWWSCMPVNPLMSYSWGGGGPAPPWSSALLHGLL